MKVWWIIVYGKPCSADTFHLIEVFEFKFVWKDFFLRLYRSYTFFKRYTVSGCLFFMLQTLDYIPG